MMLPVANLSARSDIVSRAADFAEHLLVTKTAPSVSEEELARALQKPNAISARRAREIASEAFLEIKDRGRLCGAVPSRAFQYPFQTNASQVSLRARFSLTKSVYAFLLGICRHPMSSSQRVLAGIDPTKVFEQLSADALRSLFGSHPVLSSAVTVVGTSVTNPFVVTVDSFCKALNEDSRSNTRTPGAGDGGVDAVAWRCFGDDRPGTIVVFAQCKTGEHWRDEIAKNRPEVFCKKFLTREFILSPIPMYFVPWRVDRSEWNDRVAEGGILVDRCRLLRALQAVDGGTLASIEGWTGALIAAGRDPEVPGIADESGDDE